MSITALVDASVPNLGSRVRRLLNVSSCWIQERHTTKNLAVLTAAG